MKFKASGGGDFKRAPAGTHLAVCNLIADVGMQPGSQMYPAPKRKIYVRFEIPSERVQYEKDGQQKEGPLTIGTYYTASMSEKATLRKHLEGWRGRKFNDAEAEEFDVAAILGKACMLSVVESESGGKTYSNINSISGVPKGVASPVAENPLLIFDADHDGTYEKLPNWLQEKIDERLDEPDDRTATTAGGGGSDNGFEDDDIPFITSASVW